MSFWTSRHQESQVRDEGLCEISILKCDGAERLDREMGQGIHLLRDRELRCELAHRGASPERLERRGGSVAGDGSRTAVSCRGTLHVFNSILRFYDRHLTIVDRARALDGPVV